MNQVAGISLFAVTVTAYIYSISLAHFLIGSSLVFLLQEKFEPLTLSKHAFFVLVLDFTRLKKKKGKRGEDIRTAESSRSTSGHSFTRTDAGGCWEADLLGGDVPPGSVRGAVGLGHGAHIGPHRAPAAGSDPSAVEPPLEPDPGQGVLPAAAEGFNGLAAGRGDFPLAVPGACWTSFFFFTSVPKCWSLPARLCV